MKVDLVMWTKNGAKTLDSVLTRIEKAIPTEDVNQKIIIDDSSVDNTREIAKKHGWLVFYNALGGIANGTNQAFNHVTTDYFCSFEQDVLLSPKWWPIVKALMVDGVGCVQGLRFSTVPTLREFEEEHYSRFKSIYVSIDNNLFRTKAVEDLGGFPIGCPVCTDTILKTKMGLDGRYKWVITDAVISDHIRKSIRQTIHHAYIQKRRCARTLLCGDSNAKGSIAEVLRLFTTSGIRGLDLARRYRNPSMALLYPYMRYVILEEEVKRRF